MPDALQPLIRLWHKTAPSIPVHKTIEGTRVYMDLRDNIHYLVMLHGKLSCLEPRVFAVLDCVQGPVWDVGCNIGAFSIRAAKLGHSVTAFDLSSKAIDYLQRTASYNQLDITAIDRPVTVSPTTCLRPDTSHTENKVDTTPGSTGGLTCNSLTFLQAADRYGIPRLLKMDIEGGEEEFLRSPEFKDWIRKNRIAWLLEVHRHVSRNLLWDDIPFIEVDTNHLLIHAEPVLLASVSERLPIVDGD